MIRKISFPIIKAKYKPTKTKEGNIMEKKQNKKLIVAIVVVVIAALAMFGLYKTFMPKAKAGDKEITVVVVHGDKSEKEFKYSTDEEYLAPVILENKLAEGEDGEFGLFITTVDGEIADDSKQQWWCITEGGKAVTTSASELVIEDGDQFELTLTEGY